MSNRIRWEATKYGGWTGHTGTLKPWLFQIWRPLPGTGRWVLQATFPGAASESRYADDPDDLKGEAERWLEEFIASLGASFEDPPADQMTAPMAARERD